MATRFGFLPKRSSLLYELFRCVENACNRILFAASLRSRKKFSGRSERPRILISKLDAIGDFVIFSPLLPRLRGLFPDAHLVLLIRPEVYNLAETCPYVDEIWTIDQRLFRRSLREHLRWYKVLRDGNFDMALNVVYSTATDFFECLVGWTAANRRIGFDYRPEKGGGRTGSLYYTEQVPDVQSGHLFEMSRNSMLLSYLGDREPPPTQPFVWVTDKDRQSTQALLSSCNLTSFAVLFPGARDRYRSWSVANFVSLARQFADTDMITWVIAGGPSDRELCQAVERELHSSHIFVCNLAGETTLRQLACLIESAEFCVSSETCSVHIAAAVSTPCLCILGGGHFGRFYPYPGNPLTQAVTNRLPCFNCNWNCSRSEVECITGISVGQAIAALRVLRKSVSHAEMNK